MPISTPEGRPVEWARDVIVDPMTVFLDTETTGLDGMAEIVDIAVIDGQGAILLDTLVRPTRRIPAGATRIHGIRDEHVAAAPTWDDVFSRLVPIVKGRRVVVFNADYDRKIIRQCCTESGLSLPQSTWQCAMRAHAEYMGEPGWKGKGFRWHKLENAALAFGIPPGGHRALADAEACRLVVQRMATES